MERYFYGVLFSFSLSLTLCASTHTEASHQDVPDGLHLYEEDDFDDPWGYGEEEDEAVKVRSVQKEYQGPTTDDYLRDALGNLVETEELGDACIEMLDQQREVLVGSIIPNLKRVDESEKKSDILLTKLKHPWTAKSHLLKKRFEQKRLKPAPFRGDKDQEGLVAVLHKSWFGMKKRWNKKILTIEGDILFSKSKKTGEIDKTISLMGAEVRALTVDSYKKTFCVEVERKTEKKSKRKKKKKKYKSEFFTFQCKTRQERNAWVSAIRERIEFYQEQRGLYPADMKPEQIAELKKDHDKIISHSSRQNGKQGENTKERIYMSTLTEEQNQLLDGIHDKLGSINEQAKVIGYEIEDQTDLIEACSEETEYLSDRFQQHIKTAKEIN